MTTAFQPRELVRAQPYRTQITFVQSAVANNGLLTAAFDVSLVVADRNQLKAGSAGLVAVGPFLDVMVVSDKVGTVSITQAVDGTAAFFNITGSPLALAANTFFSVAGLRITSRFITVQYQNTSGVAAVTDFAAFVGSI